MESIARFMIASTDLLEAEGRALRNQAVKLLIATAIGVAALAMTLAGLGFVFFGLFWLLARFLGGPGVAALIFGAVALAGAAAGLFAIKKVFAASRPAKLPASTAPRPVEMNGRRPVPNSN